MKFDYKFLDQLRSRLTLSDIVGDSIRLTKKGREHLGLCPFHKEKTPSFTVNDEKEFYHCFGCGAHGDAIRFLVDHRGYAFFDAVRELAQRAGLSLPESIHEDNRQPVDTSLFDVMTAAGEWYHEQLFAEAAREAQGYLEERGFTPEDVKTLKLGYAPRGREGLKQVLLNRGYTREQMIEAGLLVQPDEGAAPYDRFRGRILFPIDDIRGRLVGFGGRILGEGEPKYLNSPETPIFSKGHMLYGYHHARQNMLKGDPVIVAEGYMDVLALRKAGYAGAVAPMGTALTEDQISLLWRISFEPILCFDGDRAGIKAAHRAAERSLPLLRPGYTLKFAHLPQGEDPDTMVRGGKKSLLKQILAEGQSLLDILWEGLIQGKDLGAPEQQALLLKHIDQLTKRAEHGSIASTFRSALREKYYGLRKKGRLVKRSTIKLARPQHAFDKSLTILLAILIRHPYLLDEVGEQLATLEIEEDSLVDVKDALLSFAAQEQDYTPENLQRFIVEMGLRNQMTEILGSDAVASLPWTREEAAESEALEGWQEIYRNTQRHQIEAEVQDIQAQLAQEMTEENWRRLVELKKLL